MDDNKSTAAAFITSHSYSADEWGWDSGSVLNTYNDYNGNSTNIPQSVIIDLDGNVRYAKFGAFGTAPAVAAVINELI